MAAKMYRNPRFFDKSNQTVIFYSPIKAYTHRVRDIQPIDGQTYGWVRHQGGDWVVRLTKDHSGPGLDAWTVSTAVTIQQIVRC